MIFYDEVRDGDDDDDGDDGDDDDDDGVGGGGLNPLVNWNNYNTLDQNINFLSKTTTAILT